MFPKVPATMDKEVSVPEYIGAIDKTLVQKPQIVAEKHIPDELLNEECMNAQTHRMQ